MSTEEKVDLASSVWEEYGLTPSLAVLELPKSTWYYHRNQKISYKEKYAQLRPTLEEIIRKNPAYGAPRITKELYENYGLFINHKVVQRLLRTWDLAILRTVKNPKPSPMKRAIDEAGDRANLVAQMEHIGLFEVAYTDFTEILYANGARKAYLMPIIGHVCKMVYGWALGKSANTDLALMAWEKAKTTFGEHDIPYLGMIIHHDQDPVYTGYRWLYQLLLQDQGRVSYALNGPRDNPEMESFNDRFKTEGCSLFLDAQNMSQLIGMVDRQMNYYNEVRRHSSIGQVSPLTYIEQARTKKEGA